MFSQLLGKFVISQRNLIEVTSSLLSSSSQRLLIHVSSLLNEASNAMRASSNRGELEISASKSRRQARKKQRDKAEFIRISNINSRGGAYRKFRVRPDELAESEDDLSMKPGISDRIDPESLDKLNDDLDLYAQNEFAYHHKVIDEDIRERRRVKIGIIKKKIAKLEGRVEENFNLLTWDAKEQIKHLNIVDPGSNHSNQMRISAVLRVNV